MYGLTAPDLMLGQLAQWCRITGQPNLAATIPDLPLHVRMVCGIGAWTPAEIAEEAERCRLWDYPPGTPLAPVPDD